jgi:hypothetical protein
MATKRAECTFVVKDGGNNRPLIQIEPTIVSLDISFALRKGTTIDAAHELAREMGRRIVSIALNVPEEPYAPNIVEGPTTKQ